MIDMIDANCSINARLCVSLGGSSLNVGPASRRTLWKTWHSTQVEHFEANDPVTSPLHNVPATSQQIRPPFTPPFTPEYAPGFAAGHTPSSWDRIPCSSRPQPMISQQLASASLRI